MPLSLGIVSWPVSSQQRARRNAMVALTALAQRRAEREDVEAYLSQLAAPSTPRPVHPVVDVPQQREASGS